MIANQWLSIRILMCIHRSLLGAITPNLRSVTYRWRCNRILVNCYYNGELTEHETELMNAAETKVTGDFWEGWSVEFKCIRNDQPNWSPEKGHSLIYSRPEET